MLLWPVNPAKAAMLISCPLISWLGTVTRWPPCSFSVPSCVPPKATNVAYTTKLRSWKVWKLSQRWYSRPPTAARLIPLAYFMSHDSNNSSLKHFVHLVCHKVNMYWYEMLFNKALIFNWLFHYGNQKAQHHRNHRGFPFLRKYYIIAPNKGSNLRSGRDKVYDSFSSFWDEKLMIYNVKTT